MNTELSDGYEDSENEINDKQHARLLENVLNLDSKQYVKKPTRTEPTLEISEFNLVKSITGTRGTVRLQDLTTSLKKRASHVQLGNKIKRTEQKSQTLQKPLGKPQAERIRRTVAYANTKNLLDRWEPVVTANRAATTLTFPLDKDIALEENNDSSSRWRLKTRLQEELEKLEPEVETFEVGMDKKFPLTMEEMMERRKEFAKLRRYQNYKEIKARRQNKIKSKKYRRVLRREKIKQQMKEFELLQKTNPEEALKKLEEIEKARAEERVSLRHKSTGKWARNQQVRAKYDKESRKTLAQQLTISKELTQKMQVNDSSDSGDDTAEAVKSGVNQNDNNPWIENKKPTSEVEDFLSGYQKFWDQQNKVQEEIVKEENENRTPGVHISLEVEVNNDNYEDQKIEEVNNGNGQQQMEKQISVKSNQKNSKFKVKKSKSLKHQEQNGLNESMSTSSDWEVTPGNAEMSVDDVFDDLEFKLKSKTQKKYKSLIKNDSILKESKTKRIEKSKTIKRADLAIPVLARKPIIDEELTETTNIAPSEDRDFNILKSILQRKETKAKTVDSIEPKKLINAEPVNLNTDIPDLFTLDDNEGEVDQRGIIAEAFEDDDIADEFAKDKKEEIEKDTPKDIDLNLPGWGCWGGKNIQPSKRRTKRFIIKFPKEMPRKDKNKGDLIINENANKKVKTHLVSEVPFPFKSVKDFEASIRAPIGNTFVTESAFKKLIQPSIITKMGTVIEPMTEDILLKKKKKRRQKI